MRGLRLAMLLVAFPLASLAPVASAEGLSGPYIDHVGWVGGGGASLRVYPSTVGRAVAGQLDKSAVQSEQAWREVLAWAPEADTPGMRAQFVCHWHFAELAQPGKTSWNLEAWRPFVDDDAMVASRCNPGGAEEVL
ncbi:Protein of unknown function DUF2599 [Mycobacteriaceae bacterium]